MNFSKNRQKILLISILLICFILIPSSFAQSNNLNDTVNELDINKNHNLQDLEYTDKEIVNSEETNTNNI